MDGRRAELRKVSAHRIRLTGQLVRPRRCYLRESPLAALLTASRPSGTVSSRPIADRACFAESRRRVAVVARPGGWLLLGRGDVDADRPLDTAGRPARHHRMGRLLADVGLTDVTTSPARP